MVYLVDVLALVPYVGAGVDGIVGFTDEHTRFAFGAHPVAGLDWLLDRSFMVGLCVRPVFVLSEFDTQPVQLTASLTFAALFDL
jgi:outer membrane protein W